MGKWNAGEGKAITFLRQHASYSGDNCIIWPLARDQAGYGMMRVNGRFGRASRFMCEMVNGSPPTPKHQAAHSCGNGHLGCVTPGHLSWKTNAENQMDSVRHGTVGRKPGVPRFKLTPEKVAQIRALKGQKTAVELGLMFGVSRDAIDKVLAGITWKTGQRVVGGFDRNPWTKERREASRPPRI